MVEREDLNTRHPTPTFREKLKQVEGLIKGRILYDEPMSRYTSYGIGGPADALIFPRDVEDLKAILRIAKEEQIPYFILGGGSNTLVRDGGIRGIVINLEGAFQELSSQGEEVRAGAGVRLSRLLAFCSKMGLSGLEPLTGVPGTVGGAVWGNAGAFGGAISDRLVRLRLVTCYAEELILDRKSLAFSYRRSYLPEGSVIVEATFALMKGDPLAIRRRISQLLVQRNRSQPVELRSCGSVFKNPPGDYAGRLVEAAGLKGFRIGDAQVSPKHGNFIVNLGGAKARDVLALIELVKDRVKKEQGVELEPEIKIVGED